MAARRSRMAVTAISRDTQYEGSARARGRGGDSRRLRLTRPEPREADVLASVIQYLAIAERQGLVAWYARLNSGAGRLVDRHGRVGQWTRWGFAGLPDILGQLPDGRLLALEVKRPSGRLRPQQTQFLDVVAANRGVAAVVRSVDDVVRVLGAGRLQESDRLL